MTRRDLPPAAAGFDRWRHRFAAGLAVASVVLLAAGGLVTSTGSGLAVPDWPLSFGQFFPPMAGGVLYEHSHRLIAAAVGLLTLVLAAWFALTEPRRPVRIVAYLALGAVVVQGVLGGITVLLRLPLAVSAAHACLAQIFFGLVVTLAVVTSRRYLEPAPPGGDGRRVLAPAALAAALVFGQLVLGAVMRHSGAGLAIPDVPLAFGRLVPPIGSFGVAIHFAHRVGAVTAAAAVAWTAARALRTRRAAALAAPALAALALVTAQILLGATAVLTRLAVLPTTLHLVTGALLLTTLLLLCLRAARGASGRAAAATRATAAAEAA